MANSQRKLPRSMEQVPQHQIPHGPRIGNIGVERIRHRETSPLCRSAQTLSTSSVSLDQARGPSETSGHQECPDGSKTESIFLTEWNWMDKWMLTL